MPKVLARGDIGQMDLHGRQRDGLERVKNRHARVRIGGRIDDDAVGTPEAALDHPDQPALGIGLRHEDFRTVFPCVGFDRFNKRRIVGSAVNVRLAYAEHIEIGSVEDSDSHQSGSFLFRTRARISRAVCAGSPSFSTVRSAYASYSGRRAL